MINEIFVRDNQGFNALRYLLIEEQHGTRYFGGNAHHLTTLDAGPHVWHYEGSMLPLLGRLAQTDGSPYSLLGGKSGDSIQLMPEMNAELLAGILGIPTEHVVHHYGLLVRVS